MSANHMNRATLIGNVGGDPEKRTFGNGGSVVSFSLATNESWKDKGSGERKTKTEWHRISIFNEHLGNVALDYVKKGSLILVEGNIATRKWVDKDGVDRYSTEINVPKFGGELKLLGIKGETGEGKAGNREPDRGNNRDDHHDDGGGLDDEIPF